MMNAAGFSMYTLDIDADLFDALAHSVEFEDVTQGRRGNHLVDTGEQGVPIVRTTTQFTKPAHCFSPVHHHILTKLSETLDHHDPGRPAVAPFNNALIEVYERTYVKMGYHSDQALDLKADSMIALYSCYEHPEATRALRTLKIKNRTTGEETSLELKHNTVVLFSLETNAQYLHKIVLEQRNAPRTDEEDNRWLGITFRTSGTFIQFEQQRPQFQDGTVLAVADDAQRKMFYRLRGQENRDMAFRYPTLDYTISVADTLMPIVHVVK